MDAEPLLLDSDMPERINHELGGRWATHLDEVAGNEPVFARVIFESLAARYALRSETWKKCWGGR